MKGFNPALAWTDLTWGVRLNPFNIGPGVSMEGFNLVLAWKDSTRY
jgi:hypothetical protein